MIKNPANSNSKKQINHDSLHYITIFTYCMYGQIIATFGKSSHVTFMLWYVDDWLHFSTFLTKNKTKSKTKWNNTKQINQSKTQQNKTQQKQHKVKKAKMKEQNKAKRNKQNKATQNETQSKMQKKVKQNKQKLN